MSALLVATGRLSLDPGVVLCCAAVVLRLPASGGQPRSGGGRRNRQTTNKRRLLYPPELPRRVRAPASAADDDTLRAPIRNRTVDLLLTMETLCRLSYWGSADERTRCRAPSGNRRGPNGSARASGRRPRTSRAPGLRSRATRRRARRRRGRRAGR